MNVTVCDKVRDADLALVPGKNFVTGVDTFEQYFGKITSVEADLLVLSSAIYATDLAVKREKAEDFIRTIEVDVELVNKAIFDNVKNEIERALFVLSCDNWTINFIPKKGILESGNKFKSDTGKVLLFSGGLDSFCAADHLLKKKDNISLVSHVTHNKIIENSQINLKRILENFYKTKIERFPFRIFARSLKGFNYPEVQDREDSQRIRSFLFLTLGGLVARRKGFDKIVMIAENGQFAIHLPLTSARVGPFSTHTAHPEFLNIMENLLRKLLNLPNLNILNPYQYMTKAEVVSGLEGGLRKAISESISCWRSSRLKTQFHCGECIPCLTRRIALETQGILLPEYEKDLFKTRIDLLDPDDIGKRNLVDLIEFIKQFSLSATENSILESFPDLYNQYFNPKEVISMYKKFSIEALKVFKKYPNLMSIIQ
jgi:7-cyano-7-deazaguanine synthase in queuosine biosynthesis